MTPTLAMLMIVLGAIMIAAAFLIDERRPFPNIVAWIIGLLLTGGAVAIAGIAALLGILATRWMG